jgi:flagellar hook-length control protein FliK
MSKISMIDSLLSAQGTAVSNSASAGSATLFAQTLQQSIAAQTNAAKPAGPAQQTPGTQQSSSSSAASGSQPQQNNSANNANASSGTGTVHPGDSAQSSQSSQPAQPGSSQDASSTKSSSSTDNSAQQAGNTDNSKAGDANSKSQDAQASNGADASAAAAAAAAAAAQAQARANAAADANQDASTAADAAAADAAAAALAGDAKTDGTGDHKGLDGLSTGGKSIHQKVDSALAALNSGRTDLVAALPMQNFAAGAANGASSDKASADLVTGGHGNANGKGFGIGPMLGDAKAGTNGAMNNGMQMDNASVAATAAQAQQATQTNASAAAAATAAANADAAAATSLPAATDGIDALNAALAASQAGGAGAAASGGTNASQAAKSGAAAYTDNALAPEVGSTDWDEALSQKVVFMSNMHQQSAELTLNPANLGPLQVTLQIADNHAHALFVSQHQEVRAAIEAALPKLRDAMEQNGIGLGSTSVSDGFARHNGQQAQDGGRSGGSRGGYDSGSADNVVATTVTTSGPTRRTVGLVDTFA